MDIQENDFFIKSIKINQVRHLKDIEIHISDTERKHLIITGKNGSGKTSLLNEMRETIRLTNVIKKRYHSVILELNKNKKFEDLLITFFGSKRLEKFIQPLGIKKIDLELDKINEIDFKINSYFLQYIVNIWTQKSFAKELKDFNAVEKIDNWFYNFENLLKEIFQDNNLKLEFDYKNFTFNFIQENKEKFDFNTLSDGYAAVLNIVTELLLRMENETASNSFDVQGIVLIDEVETHLHIGLQKHVLPFLTKVFPKIQFIVTTHSPFVIQSIENAVIYDLETNKRFENLSYYSSESLLETYYEMDKFSSVLKTQMEEYENLLKSIDYHVHSEKILHQRQHFLNIPDIEISYWIKDKDIKYRNIIKELLSKVETIA